MTKEIRTLIDLEDILGVEIECPHQNCGAKMLVPISGAISDNGVYCFQCRNGWFGATPDIRTNTLNSAALKQINELMARIRQLSSKDRSDIHAPIRLQIRNLESQSWASDRASSGKD